MLINTGGRLGHPTKPAAASPASHRSPGVRGPVHRREARISAAHGTFKLLDTALPFMGTVWRLALPPTAGIVSNVSGLRIPVSARLDGHEYQPFRAMRLAAIASANTVATAIVSCGRPAYAMAARRPTHMPQQSGHETISPIAPGWRSSFADHPASIPFLVRRG